MNQNSAPTGLLNVSLLLDTATPMAWQRKVIDDLRQCDFVKLTLVRLHRSARSRWKNRLSMLTPPAFRFYEKADYYYFRGKSHQADAFVRFPLATIDDNLEPLLTVPVDGSDTIKLEAFETLQNLAADVFVDLTEFGIPSDWLVLPRHGVWAIRHGQIRRTASGPFMFEEMYRNEAAAESRLEVLTADPRRNRVIYRSYSKIHQYSLYWSRNEACWKATAFVTRRLRDLYHEGPGFLNDPKTIPEIVPAESAARSGWPGWPDMIRYLTAIAQRYVSWTINEKIRKYQFTIGIRPKNSGTDKPEPTKFQLLHPPRSEFWADPFPIRVDGKDYLFFESYPYAERKGVISCLLLNNGSDPSCLIPELALERPYHLSYPFLFEYEGAVYMLPETAENRTVELYRAVEFPHRWRLEKVLLKDVNAHDPTLLAYGGRFWLFVNLSERGGSCNDELFLFYADSPLGRWTPHPRNPIISDVRRARPAGRLFYRDGRLIRPSQDCSKRYGYALNFNHVEILSETDYRESLLYKITPEGFQDFKGLHTYNASEHYEVIDLGRYQSLSPDYRILMPAPAVIPLASGPDEEKPLLWEGGYLQGGTL